MSVIEIISAILLILSCVFIIVLVLMQESKRGMSQAITGGSSDNFYQKNSGRTKEARLVRATKTAAIILFVLTITVNVVSIYFKGDGTVSDDNSSSIETEAEIDEGDSDIAGDETETSADETETPEDETETEAEVE